MNELNAKYREGLEELLFVSPVWGNLARAMGRPVFSEDEKTAWVQFDHDQKHILFSFNPDFLMTLDEETTAGVILHETHHVVLNHLNEMLADIYPDKQALIKAQECIINDGVCGTFNLPLPSFVMRGEKLAGVDMSQMNTAQGYQIFAQPQDEQPQDDQGDAEGAGEGSGADANGGGGGSGADANGGGGGSAGNPDSPADKDDDSEPQADEKADGDEDDKGAGAGQDDEPGEDNQAGSGGDEDADEAGDEAGAGEAEGDQGDTPDYGDGSCGGFKMYEDDRQNFANAVKQAFKQAAEDMGITPGEFEQRIMNTTPGGYSPTGAPVSEATQITKERMNWKLLLANINPKVLEAGNKRRKTKNNWVKYNRRMASVYPKVILPTNERIKPKKADEDGDTLPVLVIALDLSGSIDRRLVGTLQGLLNEIPEDLIRAYPATWGSNLIPYDEAHGFRVAGGGTSISNVVTYVDKIKRETKTDPYVLVITDGQYTTSHRKPGKDWYYMGVDNASVRYIERMRHNSNGHQVYSVNDFKV